MAMCYWGWWGWRVGLACLLALSGAMAAHGRPTVMNFYVATNGNDAWSGHFAEPNKPRTDGPFATLKRARDAVRALQGTERTPDEGVRVWIRGGVYSLTTGLVLTAQDGGTAASPVVYRAYPNETVRLTGGREVTGFTPVTDAAILARLDPASREKVLQADLKAQGVTDFGTLHPQGFGRPEVPAALELFFQDKPMTLARWPNQGWATIADTPAGAQGGMFTYAGDRPERWRNADDLWLHGYWTWDWADSYTQVQSIDIQKHALFTAPPHGVYGYTKGKRFYALNLLEELDEPGEWYLDRKTGILYFWPPAPLTDGKVVVSLLNEPLITLQGASYVTLRGLTLEAGRASGVEIRGGEHNRVAGCTLRNLGLQGVNVDGGTDNGVSGCDIYETGQGGISLSGGDRPTLTPAHNFADNNLIHDYSRIVRTYRPAVGIDGVGNHVSHNLIYNGPHTAILLSGNDHQIEYNEVHDVCRETGDVGAFYMGRDWTMRGNVVRYNYFHHLGGFKGAGFTDAMAIYLDDAASGTTVYGNVCYKAGRAVLIGGGRDNTVENNLFVDCDPAIHVDARGLSWAKAYIAPGGEWQMQQKLAAVHYKDPPYSTRYPKLATILEDDPAVPKGNVIRHNVCLGGKWLDLLDGLNDTTLQIQDNFVDPMPVAADWKPQPLAPNSPAYKLGFKPIPLDQIGLIKTADRP